MYPWLTALSANFVLASAAIAQSAPVAPLTGAAGWRSDTNPGGASRPCDLQIDHQRADAVRRSPARHGTQSRRRRLDPRRGCGVTAARTSPVSTTPTPRRMRNCRVVRRSRASRTLRRAAPTIAASRPDGRQHRSPSAANEKLRTLNAEPSKAGHVKRLVETGDVRAAVTPQPRLDPIDGARLRSVPCRRSPTASAL